MHCVIVDSNEFCVQACPQLFPIDINLESSQIYSVTVKLFNAHNGKKTVKKNPKKGKADKSSKPKPKTKGSAKASKTSLKAPPKPLVEEDDDLHHPQPRMYVSPGRAAKTKAIENMYCSATGRRLPLSESDISGDEEDSEDEEPVYQSKKGTKTTGLEDDDNQDMLVGKLIETPEKVKRRPIPESPADRTNKYAIHSVVGTELFPRVKFVDHVHDLVYSRTRSTICDFVLSRCKLSLRTSETVFGEKAKGWVRYCIARHRSDKATALRNVFHGKSLFSAFVSLTFCVANLMMLLLRMAWGAFEGGCI